jgi:hypothetical protein
MSLNWYPMSQAPEADEGVEMRVLACWESNDALRVRSSGEIYYLKRVELIWEDDDRPDWANDPSGCVTGWFERYEGRDGDVTFEPISDEFVTHIGWTHMPVMPEDQPC